MQRLAAQRHRVNRTVNFAQSNLAEPLDLDRLASVACLSKYHFTRVFSEHCGETPVQFLWRIRLERAARSLAFHREKSITEIALDCGFNSSQSFSRAFRQRFRLAPREVKSRDFGSFDSFGPLGATSAKRALVARWERSELRVETRPALRLAYIRHIGSYWNCDGGHALAAARLKRWVREQGLWSDDAVLIGVCPDNATLTPPGLCLYDVGFPVAQDVEEDELVSIQTIPAGRFAVLRTACSSGELESAWEWLSSTWLAASGMTYDLLHSYEVYPLTERGNSGPEEGVELCMRLKLS